MTVTLHETASVSEVRHRGGKYLTFALGDELYGLEIIKVREIIGFIEVTSVPRMPHYIRFSMEPKEITDQTCIIVVEVNCEDQTGRYGIVVDRVQEVLDVPEDLIEDAPNLDAECDTEFILGIGKIGDTVKILLDIDRVFGNPTLIDCLEN